MNKLKLTTITIACAGLAAISTSSYAESVAMKKLQSQLEIINKVAADQIKYIDAKIAKSSYTAVFADGLNESQSGDLGYGLIDGANKISDDAAFRITVLDQADVARVLAGATLTFFPQIRSGVDHTAGDNVSEVTWRCEFANGSHANIESYVNNLGDSVNLLNTSYNKDSDVPNYISLCAVPSSASSFTALTSGA